MAAKKKEEVKNTGFDFGTDDPIGSTTTFKNPEIGEHSARLKSIIHCGMCQEEFKGELKKPCPQVIAVFELKDDTDFEDDGVTPLYLHKSFALKKGDKAFMTKFLKALDPKGVAAGFDDLIGAACTVSAVGSKAVNDDGQPKYVNFGGIAGMPAKFAAMTEELLPGGAGHVPFKDITKEAILELFPVIEVANILMKGLNYEGSKAQTIIEEIRKENPEFAKPRAKDDSKKSADAQPEKESNLNENEEF